MPSPAAASPSGASSSAASPSGASPSSIRPDGRRVAVHTIDVAGRFIRARRIVFAALIAFYVALPLVKVGGHPAAHLDVAARRFYLFGGTFNAQDFWIVLFMVTAAGFGLLLLTAWHGRAWCGWACPQTVFLEALYRPIERLVDGPRSRRLKLAGAPWTAGRVGRLLLKHALYFLLSALLSHVALSLFLSASDLLAMMREGPAQHRAAFTWSVAVTGLLYFNFAWFREQLCVVLCPYGRLQSVLHDRDSVIVGYDVGRGEPRGARRRLPVVGEAARGDCVDCKKCVYACPTGIDIRNGLQMECVACAQCIDVCDDVMDRLGRPRGLIRYASLNELAGVKRRVWRPRLVVYIVLTALATGALIVGLVGRTSFEANVVRPPGVPWLMEQGQVRNQLEIHLINKNPTTARFHLQASSPIAGDLRLGQTDVTLGSLEGIRIPLVITFARRDARREMRADVTITDLTRSRTRHQSVRLVAPGL